MIGAVPLLAGIVGFFYSASFGDPGEVDAAIGVLDVIAIWGLIFGDHESILGFLPVNTEDDVLHLLLAALGIGAYLASAPRASERVPCGRPD